MNFIPRGIKAYAYGAAIASLLALLAWTYHRGKSDQKAADAPIIRAAKLGEENAIARADSTRHVMVARYDSATGALRDSVDVAYRRAEQLELDRMRITDSLRIQRVITAQLQLQSDTLRARVAAAVTTDSAGTRYASFHEKQGPITVDVAVEVPEFDSARAEIVATVDPPLIDVDGGCSDAPPGGVRSAYLTASAPGWGRVDIGRLAFTPDVCNAVPVIIRPDFGQKVKSGIPWLVAGAVLTAAGIAVF